MMEEKRKSQEFLKQLQQECQVQYPEAELQQATIHRNNGISYEGVWLRWKKPFCGNPVFPLETLQKAYEKGEQTLENIVRHMADETGKDAAMFDFSVLEDYRKAKSKLFIKLVNREKNQDKLEGFVHLPFLDLEVLFGIIVSQDEEKEGICLVTQQIRKYWGITEGKLYQDAYQNMMEDKGFQLISLEDLLTSMLGLNEEADTAKDITSPMYVLGRKERYYGAAIMLLKEKLQTLTQSLPWSSFYLLPSSIHELILLPEPFGEVEMLKNIIKQVNDNEVSPEEILSYHIYHYNRKTGEISDLCAA